MEEIICLAGAHVRAIEAHDMEALVLHPNAPLKAPAVVLPSGCDVKHQAAYFTQKLPPYILEFVVLLIEAVRIDIDHLQETARQKLHGHRQEGSQPARGVLQVW